MVELRHLGNDWRNTIWKIVRNPAFEVVAAILVVIVAAWVVISLEVDQKADHKKSLFPVPYSHSSGHR